jgi:phosphoribosylanthranilate isomerase
MIVPSAFSGLVRTRIKICGITRPEDARAAIESGADLLGFNLWTGSRRFVRLEAVRPWLMQLAPVAVRVAVMVNPTMNEVERAMATRCFEAVQLHGKETPEFCRELIGRGFRCLKALPVSGLADAVPVSRYGEAVILLDAQQGAAFGGTGRTVDPGVAADIVAANPGRRIFLAGGLTPANVAESVRRVRPFGVDVAGGVESAPGIKSPDLIRQFCESVRGAMA